VPGLSMAEQTNQKITKQTNKSENYKTNKQIRKLQNKQTNQKNKIVQLPMT
jgi:hypothetical protein